MGPGVPAGSKQAGCSSHPGRPRNVLISHAAKLLNLAITCPPLQVYFDDLFLPYGYIDEPYNVTVQASNQWGAGPVGPVVTLATPPRCACAPPIRVVLLSWGRQHAGLSHRELSHRDMTACLQTRPTDEPDRWIGRRPGIGSNCSLG